ncbi:hypothetical protein [Nocardioides pacificus]
MNDATGDLTLNSTVAHIHARRENGPRWNASMSEEDNRSESNLILLCLEHSSEVDDVPDEYPAEQIQAWKVTIRDEYDRFHQSWTITEDQVAEVFAASFSMREFARTTVESTSVAACVRLAATLMETVITARRPAHLVSAGWEALRRRTNDGFFAYDDRGERVFAQPPEIERRRFTDDMVAALTAVRDQLEPTVQSLAAELRTLKATNAELADWADWVEREARDLLTEATRASLDEVADVDMSGLSAAIDALSAKWRGDSAAIPPEPEPVPSEEVDEAAKVRAMLRGVAQATAPWRRVNTREYDESLYDALVAGLPYAATFPPIVSNMPLTLDALADGAASVLRNADDEVWERRIGEAHEQEPCAVAVLLLQHLSVLATDSGRETAAERAVELMNLRLHDQVWTGEQPWVDNVMHVRELLDATVPLVGINEIRDQVSTVLQSLAPIVVLEAIANWREESSLFGSFDFNSPGVAVPVVSQLPDWLPVAEFEESVRGCWSDLNVADLDSGDTGRRLAAEFLHLIDRFGVETP